MRTRAFLRGITPPYVAAAVRRLRRVGRPPSGDWEYLGTEWADRIDDGWNADSVVEAYARKLDPFRAAIAAPEGIGVPTEAILDCVPTQYDQNVALGYLYGVARAAARRERISILDWGGGFGFMALLVRELFPHLEVDFHVKEVPAIARAAREHVDRVTFWEDESCLDRSYDLVSACSSLQYWPDWQRGLARLGAAAPFLLLTRTPVAATPTSFVVLQRAYGTSYPGWVFSRDALLAEARTVGLTLERELLEGWSPDVPGLPATPHARGYLFSSTVATDLDGAPPA